MQLNFRTKPRLLDVGSHDGQYVLSEVTGSRLTDVQVLQRFDMLLEACRRATTISADDATKQRLRPYGDIATKLR